MIINEKLRSQLKDIIDKITRLYKDRGSKHTYISLLISYDYDLEICIVPYKYNNTKNVINMDSNDLKIPLMYRLQRDEILKCCTEKISLSISDFDFPKQWRGLILYAGSMYGLNKLDIDYIEDLNPAKLQVLTYGEVDNGFNIVKSFWDMKTTFSNSVSTHPPEVVQLLEDYNLAYQTTTHKFDEETNSYLYIDNYKPADVAYSIVNVATGKLKDK